MDFCLLNGVERVRLFRWRLLVLGKGTHEHSVMVVSALFDAAVSVVGVFAGLNGLDGAAVFVGGLLVAGHVAFAVVFVGLFEKQYFVGGIDYASLDLSMGVVAGHLAGFHHALFVVGVADGCGEGALFVVDGVSGRYQTAIDMVDESDRICRRGCLLAEGSRCEAEQWQYEKVAFDGAGGLG